MTKHPYKQFLKKELILRDHLAIDRTRLANDRSFLAYIRTGFTICLTGITLLKLFDGFVFHIVGWGLMILAVVTILIGYMKKKTMHQLMSSFIQDTEE